MPSPSDYDRLAPRAYKIDQKEIRDLIGRLQAKLKDHAKSAAKKPRDWGYVGDLGHVKEKLNEILSFLGG